VPTSNCVVTTLTVGLSDGTFACYAVQGQPSVLGTADLNAALSRGVMISASASAVDAQVIAHEHYERMAQQLRAELTKQGVRVLNQ
jgi:hypothetical protein